MEIRRNVKTGPNILQLIGVKLTDIQSLEDMMIEKISNRHSTISAIPDLQHETPTIPLISPVVDNMLPPIPLNNAITPLNASNSHHSEYYEDLPTVFTSFSAWPQRTQLHCWRCSLRIRGPPIPVITDIYRDLNGNESMTPEGAFCWFRCAAAYIINMYRRDGSWTNKINMLRILYNKYSGKLVNYIEPSEPPTVMKKYCGNAGITEDEYYKRNCALIT